MFERIINYLFYKLVKKNGDVKMPDVIAEGQGVVAAPDVNPTPTPVGQAVVPAAAVAEVVAAVEPSVTEVKAVVSPAIAAVEQLATPVIAAVEETVVSEITERADRILAAVKNLLALAGHDLGEAFDDAIPLAKAFGNSDEDVADKLVGTLKSVSHDFGGVIGGILAFAKKHA